MSHLSSSARRPGRSGRAWTVVRAIVPVALSAAALASALPAPAQAAVSCTPYKPIDIRGGHAMYRECFSGPYVRVDGHMDDTRKDGKCVGVYAAYNRHPAVDRWPDRACPNGDRVYFRFPWRTSNDAYVYLYLSKA